MLRDHFCFIVRLGITTNSGYLFRKNYACDHTTNARFFQVHAGIGRSPFEAMLGTAPRVGLQTWRLPPGVAASIETEEQLRQLVGASIDTPSERHEQAAAASSAGERAYFNYLHKF